MVKIVQAEHIVGTRIRVTFSTNESGVYDVGAILARGGPMVAPLQDASFFRAFFLELGALAWKNGFELSPQALYEELKTTKHLAPSQAA